MYYVKVMGHVARDFVQVSYGEAVANAIPIGTTYTFAGVRTKKAARDIGARVLRVAAHAQGKRGEDMKDMWFDVLDEDGYRA